MYLLKLFNNTPFKKSARIVGDVMGKFHPHGDQAIYQSLVRMAQDFSSRVTLIEGQGNKYLNEKINNFIVKICPLEILTANVHQRTVSVPQEDRIKT